MINAIIYQSKGIHHEVNMHLHRIKLSHPLTTEMGLPIIQAIVVEPKVFESEWLTDFLVQQGEEFKGFTEGTLDADTLNDIECQLGDEGITPDKSTLAFVAHAKDTLTRAEGVDKSDRALAYVRWALKG
jgi:hypothetical protein